MSDGTPVPMGAVIERVCQGQVTREAYVGPNGTFGFQLGNGNVIPDASDSGVYSGMDPSASLWGIMSVNNSRNPMALADCELRAALGGYRSNSIRLQAIRQMGHVDLGTIVLHPAAMARGTTISLTEMLAPRKSRQSLDKAEKAIEKREWERAQGLLQEALGVYPRYAEAWLRLGQVLRAMCRIDEARDAFAKAIAADDSFVPPFIELAKLATHDRSWQESVDLTDHAILLDPLDYPSSFYLNAVANFNLGRLKDSEDSVRKALLIDNRNLYPQTHLLLASILHRKRDHGAEMEQLRDYLRIAPQSADAEQVRTHLQMVEQPDHGRVP
jgi:tetratricopeptide (TPR) repeat protein